MDLDHDLAHHHYNHHRYNQESDDDGDQNVFVHFRLFLRVFAILDVTSLHSYVVRRVEGEDIDVLAQFTHNRRYRDEKVECKDWFSKAVIQFDRQRTHIASSLTQYVASDDQRN